MPSFEYTALDRQGNSVQGQVQAANRDEAALNLTRTGLLVSKLDQVGGNLNSPRQPAQQIPQAPITQSPVSHPAPARSQATAPVRTGLPPVLNPQAQPRANPATGRRPIAPAKRDPIRTKKGSEKELYFIFSQLQSYAHSGQNPVVALTNVANGCRRADYRTALMAAADAAKEGRPISDTLETYIDLFPPHVIGGIRAAEAGGFFPDAYQLITEQALSSKKLDR